MAPDDETWAQIRHEYCETFEPVSDICAAHGIKLTDLANRRRKEGWPKRINGRLRSRSGQWLSAGSLLAAPHPVASAFSPVEARDAIVQRLYGTLLLKLVKLEQHMAKGGRKTSMDHERETRALDGCVRALEHITEYTAALARAAGSTGTAAVDGAASALAIPTANDAAAARSEQLRRDIAQRLERLLDQRAPSGDAGDPAA